MHPSQLLQLCVNLQLMIGKEQIVISVIKHRFVRTAGEVLYHEQQKESSHRFT